MGQLELEDDDVPDLAANVEKTLSVAFELHFSQAWAFRLSGFSRNAVTCSHFLQRYSKIGMASLLTVLTEELLSPPAPVAPRVVQAVLAVRVRRRRTLQIVQGGGRFALGQELVSAADQVEPARRIAIAAVRIGMMSKAGAAKRPANLRLAGGFRHAEDGSGFPVALLHAGNLSLPIPIWHGQ